MEVPKSKNNGFYEGLESDMGATTPNRVRPASNDCIFIIGSGFTPDKKKLYKHFPLLVNRSSKTLYMTLCSIYAHPLRTMQNLVNISFGNYKTLHRNINILIDMGLVQVEKKPRKIVIYDAYVTDDVYRITTKGVRVLKDITGY